MNPNLSFSLFIVRWHTLLTGPLPSKSGSYFIDLVDINKFNVFISALKGNTEILPQMSMWGPPRHGRPKNGQNPCSRGSEILTISHYMGQSPQILDPTFPINSLTCLSPCIQFVMQVFCLLSPNPSWCHDQSCFVTLMNKLNIMCKQGSFLWVYNVNNAFSSL